MDSASQEIHSSQILLDKELTHHGFHQKVDWHSLAFDEANSSAFQNHWLDSFTLSTHAAAFAAYIHGLMTADTVFPICMQESSGSQSPKSNLRNPKPQTGAATYGSFLGCMFMENMLVDIHAVMKIGTHIDQRGSVVPPPKTKKKKLKRLLNCKLGLRCIQVPGGR